MFTLKHKSGAAAALFVTQLVAVALATAGTAVADCNNSGVQVVVGTYNCQVQHCESNTGAAAGAGAGGAAGGEAGAGATAGGNCTQSNGGAAERAPAAAFDGVVLYRVGDDATRLPQL